MAKQSESYHQHTESIEVGLAEYAKKSFEINSPQFVHGGSIYDHYEDLWETSGVSLKLKNRTPLQLERDRILYSDGLRKQADKYHVLYSGQRKIIRNYTTHTMRMTHVTRSICRALNLNSDFAEAIALGAKIGAAPFIHASKKPIAEWVANEILKIDEEYVKANPPTTSENPLGDLQVDLFSADAQMPPWMHELHSTYVIDRVKKYIPWATGDNNKAYTSGQEGYWLLCTNPYTRESRHASFSPETMYGIWRHSRGLKPYAESFHHKCPIQGRGHGFHEIRWQHCTYEAMVVQYADDITWVIENLNDANNAALLHKGEGYYKQVTSILGPNIPDLLVRALAHSDSGLLYTYFIEDFVRHSKDILAQLKRAAGTHMREALIKGEKESFIGLSPQAEHYLDLIIGFLNDHVFTEPRVKNRKEMLKVISTACLDFLYKEEKKVLTELIDERALLDPYRVQGQAARAKELLSDEIHRIQLAVDIFTNMGDQEIYDFVGIQAL